MLVVPDLESPYLPCAVDSLLVRYQDAKESIDALLELLPSIFQSNRCNVSSLGSAVNAAGLILKDCGGKMVAFHHSLPSIGSGKLENRVHQQPRLIADKDGDFFKAQVRSLS